MSAVKNESESGKADDGVSADMYEHSVLWIGAREPFLLYCTAEIADLTNHPEVSSSIE